MGQLLKIVKKKNYEGKHKQINYAVINIYKYSQIHDLKETIKVKQAKNCITMNQLRRILWVIKKSNFPQLLLSGFVTTTRCDFPPFLSPRSRNSPPIILNIEGFLLPGYSRVGIYT